MVLPGALGRTHYEPAASARAPSIGQLFPHHSGVVAASLCSAWDPGAQSHIPRPVAALSQPFAVSTSGKAALYTPLPLVRTPAPRAEVGPQQPWWVRSRWSIPFLPLSLGHLGVQLWKHHPAIPLSRGSHFFGGSCQGGWVCLVLGLPHFIYVGVYNSEWGPWAGSSARCWQSGAV